MAMAMTVGNLHLQYSNYEVMESTKMLDMALPVIWNNDAMQQGKAITCTLTVLTCLEDMKNSTTLF
jgi:hypothetical protein